VIITSLIGGLGNQMFQYAVGRQLAEINSTLLKLDLSGFEEYKRQRYSLHCFKIWDHIATMEEIATFKRKRISRTAKLLSKVGTRWGGLSSATSDFYQDAIILKENGFSFDPSILTAKGNIYLEGYWQSEKYFSAIRDILLREFAFNYEQDAKSREIANQIQTTESVSLHIRRGDYAHDPLTNQYHGLCSLEYYQKAVQHITQKIPNCHFYIFSDDHPWVCENFKLDYPFTLVDHNDASTNYEDLRLMGLCRQNIIANSSFSWWGAWLNTNPEKIVVSPEKWFNDKSLDTKDLIPDGWLKI
jgi:hypothetical protein